MTARTLSLIGTWGFAVGWFVCPIVAVLVADLIGADLITFFFLLLGGLAAWFLLGIVGFVSAMIDDRDKTIRRRRSASPDPKATR